MASKTKEVSLPIKSLQQTNAGDWVVVTAKTKLNPPKNDNNESAFRMNEGQMNHMLRRVGISSPLVLKHLIALSNGTSKLTGIASFNKAGEAWERGEGANRKTGTFEKDWIGFNQLEVELGFAASQKIAEEALKFEFANAFTVKPVVTSVATVASTASAMDSIHDPDAQGTAKGKDQDEETTV